MHDDPDHPLAPLRTRPDPSPPPDAGAAAVTHPAAYYHAESGAVRFWVQVDAALVSASIGRFTLHYRYAARRSDDDPLETYLAHAQEIDAAVRRRLDSGAREPVMLQDADVKAAPPG
jgi:hypothetical protein